MVLLQLKNMSTSLASIDFTVFCLLVYKREVERELKDLIHERTRIDSTSRNPSTKATQVWEWDKQNSEKQSLRKDIIDTLQDLNARKDGHQAIQRQIKEIDHQEASSPSGIVFTRGLQDIAHKAISAYKEDYEAQFQSQHEQRRKSVARSPPSSGSGSHQDSLVASTPAVQGTSQSSRLRPDVSLIAKSSAAQPNPGVNLQFQEDPAKVHLVSQSIVDLSVLGATGPSVIPESFTITEEDSDDKLQQTILQTTESGYKTGPSVSIYPTLPGPDPVVLDLATPVSRKHSTRNPPVKRGRDVSFVADPSFSAPTQPAKRPSISNTPVVVRPSLEAQQKSPPVPVVFQKGPSSTIDQGLIAVSEEDSDSEESDAATDDSQDMTNPEDQEQQEQKDRQLPPQNPPVAGMASFSSNTIVSYQPPPFTVHFSGDTNVGEFLRNYDNYFSALNFTDTQKLKQLFFHLTGAAYNCLRVFSDHTEGGLTYKAACDRLKQFFRSKITKEEYGRLLRQRKFSPPESLETYYWDIIRLCERCSVFDQKDIIQQIVKGLPNAIGSQIWAREPKDTAELYDLLVRFSSYESLIGKRSSTLSNEDVTTLTDELVNKLNKIGFYKKPNRRRQQPRHQGRRFNNNNGQQNNWNNYNQTPRQQYRGPSRNYNNRGRNQQNHFDNRGGYQSQQQQQQQQQQYQPRYNQGQGYHQGQGNYQSNNQGYRRPGNSNWFQQRQQSG